EAAATLGVPLLGQIPLTAPVREGGDAGVPIVVSDPDSPAGEALRETAHRLAATSRTLIGRPLNLMASGGNGQGAQGHGRPRPGRQRPPALAVVSGARSGRPGLPTTARTARRSHPDRTRPSRARSGAGPPGLRPARRPPSVRGSHRRRSPRTGTRPRGRG